MVLKDYINFEQEINHPFITIRHFDVATSETKKIKILENNNFCIVINIGNMVEMQIKNDIVLFPPKNAFLIKNRSPFLLISKGKCSKYTIIQFKGELEKFLLRHLGKAVPPAYITLFKQRHFTFDFPLSIDILTQVEELYKTDFSSPATFSQLELHAKSLYLLFHIMKKILFMDYKYLDSVATPDTQYYAVIKNIFDNEINLDESLFLYNLKKEQFLKIFSAVNGTMTFEEYLREYK